MAIQAAINTGLSKSADKSTTILLVDDPNTFLTPISFVRLAATNDASPNKPRHAIKIANPENIPSMVCWRTSFLYSTSNF